MGWSSQAWDPLWIDTGLFMRRPDILSRLIVCSLH